MPVLLKGAIFIVTDDLATSEALESLFQSIQIKAISYASATQAVSAYKTSLENGNPPQFVLVDASLKGDRDGFQISEEIAEADVDDVTIRVILTDKDFPFTKLITANSGASAVLRKSQVTGLGIIHELDSLFRRKAERRTERTRPAKGEMGGSWFSNREMGQYAINLLALVVIIWMVARMDAQLTFLTRKIEIVEQNLNNEAGTRSMSFNALDGSIKEVKGALSQINKGK